MKRLTHLKWLFGPLALFALALPLVADPTTYTYTGNDFEFASGPYTLNDFVSGSFTVASPLADNLASSTITPTSYSFTDGVQTFTSLAPPTDVFFDITTNASGVITGWDIDLQTGLNAVETFNAGSDTGEMPASEGYVIGDPGTWTASGATASTPEPEGLGLFTLGAIALGFGRRRFAQHKA